MKKNLFAILAVCMFCACSQNHVPSDLIQPQQMKIILWQMTVADQVAESDTSRIFRLKIKDSITAAYQKIFSDNKVSLTDFKKSIRYYESKTELMQNLVDSLYSYGNRTDSIFKKVYKLKVAPMKPPVIPPNNPASFQNHLFNKQKTFHPSQVK